MSINHFQEDLFSHFARVGKVLGNSNRLAIIELLAQGERHVEGLANSLNMTIANTSQHLQLLRHTGLVSARKQGQHVFYQLTSSDVVALLGLLKRVAELHISEIQELIQKHLTCFDALEPITAIALQHRLRAGDVTVLDVRPAEEYGLGHLPGAINIPLDHLDEQIKSMNSDHEVIAYCRGKYCVLAYQAVAKLRRQGMRARRLCHGFPEWKLAGNPVEASRR